MVRQGCGLNPAAEPGCSVQQSSSELVHTTRMHTDMINVDETSLWAVVYQD